MRHSDWLAGVLCSPVVWAGGAPLLLPLTESQHFAKKNLFLKAGHHGGKTNRSSLQCHLRSYTTNIW